MEAPREGNGERNAVKVARCVRRGEHAPAHEVGRFLPYVRVRESLTHGEGRQVIGCLEQKGTRDAERRNCLGYHHWKAV